MDTLTSIVTVLALHPVANVGWLRAQADVAAAIHGVRVRADGSGTAVTLPRYRAPDGAWRAAVTLPDEVRGPKSNAVI